MIQADSDKDRGKSSGLFFAVALTILFTSWVYQACEITGEKDSNYTVEFTLNDSLKAYDSVVVRLDFGDDSGEEVVFRGDPDSAEGPITLKLSRIELEKARLHLEAYTEGRLSLEKSYSIDKSGFQTQKDSLVIVKQPVENRPEIPETWLMNDLSFDSAVVLAGKTVEVVVFIPQDAPTPESAELIDAPPGTELLPGESSVWRRTFRWTPGDEQEGLHRIVIQASLGDSVRKMEFQIRVRALDKVPFAEADGYTIEEDGILQVRVDSGVLANDTVATGEELQADLISGPYHGKIQWNSDGSFSYTPESDFFGRDSFTYIAKSASGDASDSTLVLLNVLGVNDDPVAVRDSASVLEDSAVTVDVLANDIDIEGETMVITATRGAKLGSVEIQDGKLRYVPDADKFGLDSVGYTISDGNGGNSEGLLVVNILPVNDAPRAEDDVASGLEGTEILIDVLANDVDVDGDSIKIGELGNASHGTLHVEKDGRIRYSPEAQFNGSDTFTYRVEDTQGARSNEATVTIHVGEVNDPPVAVNDIVTIPEGQKQVLEILSNDSDPEGGVLVIASFTQPNLGAITRKSDGSLEFEPTDSDVNGSDFFTYVVQDAQGAKDTARVDLIIEPVNDAPTAHDDFYSTEEDTPISFNVLENDKDVDNDILILIAVGNHARPSQGSVSFSANGSILYTPDSNTNGTDRFSYVVDDQNGGLDTGMVTVSIRAVNDAPVFTKVPQGNQMAEVGDIFVAQVEAEDVDGDELNFSVSGPSGMIWNSGQGRIEWPVDRKNPVFRAGATFSVTVSVDDGNAPPAKRTFSVQTRPHRWEYKGSILGTTDPGEFAASGPSRIYHYATNGSSEGLQVSVDGGATWAVDADASALNLSQFTPNGMVASAGRVGVFGREFGHARLVIRKHDGTTVYNDVLPQSQSSPGDETVGLRMTDTKWSALVFGFGGPFGNPPPHVCEVKDAFPSICYFSYGNSYTWDMIWIDESKILAIGQEFVRLQSSSVDTLADITGSLIEPRNGSFSTRYILGTNLYKVTNVYSSPVSSSQIVLDFNPEEIGMLDGEFGWALDGDGKIYFTRNGFGDLLEEEVAELNGTYVKLVNVVISSDQETAYAIGEHGEIFRY